MPEFLFSSLDCYRSLRSFFILRFSRRILRLAAMLARSSTVVHSLRCASCKTQTASTITRKICANFAFYASLRSAENVGRSTVVAAGDALRLASLGEEMGRALGSGGACWCACTTCPTCPNGRAWLIFLQKNLSTLGFRT